MNLRPFLFAAVFVPSASFAATGDTCNADTFETTCNDDGTLQLCDNFTTQGTSVEAELSCAEAFGLAGTPSCGTPVGCVGSCDEFDSDAVCLSPIGSGCIGLSPQINGSTTDDDFAFAVQCEGDATCQVGVNAAGTDIEDTCVAHMGPACTAGGEGASCVGDSLVLCLGDAAGTFALTSNVAVDCTLFDATCGEQACECDAQCGTGGTCTNGTCEGGVTCAFTPDAADCTSGGEGEGEGEGEDDNGTGTGRRDDEAEEEPAALCSTTGTMDASFGFALLGLGLVAVRRRRR
jgi:MYXO-CTERM domain-containing protein